MENNQEQERIENLLKPRYKVIADYPQSIWTVGDVLPEFPPSWCAENLDKFPNIFRKLEWWEEREESEMPEYVKDKFGKVYKPFKYYAENGAWMPSEHAQFGNGTQHYLPATLEEYTTYIKQ